MGKGAKGCITLVVGKQEQNAQIALPQCDITSLNWRVEKTQFLSL